MHLRNNINAKNKDDYIPIYSIDRPTCYYTFYLYDDYDVPVRKNDFIPRSILFNSSFDFEIKPLYRGDQRGFDIVFKEGFSAKGTNTNLIEHARGQKGDSAYIATSTAKEVAKKFPKLDIVFGTFVYEIHSERPAINVYKEIEILGLGDSVISPFLQYEHERAFLEKIYPHEIKSVEIVLYDNKIIIPSENRFILNQNFQPPSCRNQMIINVGKYFGKGSASFGFISDSYDLYRYKPGYVLLPPIRKKASNFS